jgi:hypothetical protein
MMEPNQPSSVAMTNPTMIRISDVIYPPEIHDVARHDRDDHDSAELQRPPRSDGDPHDLAQDAAPAEVKEPDDDEIFGGGYA